MFSDIILELRKSRQWTQSQLAKKLNVGDSTIAMWENGSRTPTRAKYEAIADLFNVDLDYLYGKTDIKRRVVFDEFGEMYKRDNLPELSDKAIQIAIAYDRADTRVKIGVEVALGVNFTSDDAGAGSSGSERLRKEA